MNEKNILLAHGSGGRLSHNLVKNMIIPLFSNPALDLMDDSARICVPGGEIAFTTDSFVVTPRFFPGGDIGSLSVYGTANDLAVCGAVPEYMSLALIIEEGFSTDELSKILESIKHGAKRCSVKIVTGDTKVVEKGSGDGIFINTAGIGRLTGYDFRPCVPGDHIITSGDLGRHGAAVLAAREEIFRDNRITSDCGPVFPLVSAVMEEVKSVKFMRDPTRGGAASVLNELAESGSVELKINEACLPLSSSVEGLCEALGIDPLYLACEGRVIFVVGREDAERTVEILRKTPGGEGAGIIGEVTEGRPGRVIMVTKLGGRRILDMPVGEPLPRIC
ncbi:MAG: hydrogenase expression/formation protein HypE [Chloroflexi bacterium]|nr:hydrogenase expression/formation protein HypE [Chloroflexota bacterium]